MKLKPETAILVRGTIAIAIMVTSAVVGWLSFEGLAKSVADVQRSQAVMSAAGDLLTDFLNLETSQRGYLLMRDDAFLAPYTAALPRLPERIAVLREKCAYDHDQAARVDEIDRITPQALQYLEDNVTQMRTIGASPAIADRLREGKTLMDRTRGMLNVITTVETGRLNLSTAQMQQRVLWAKWATLGGGGTAIFLLLLSGLSLRRQAKAQREATERTEALNQNLQGHTARLEDTNEELEFFISAVSHDLRAPLRTVDGFARAAIEEAGETLDPNVRSSLERVRGAAAKMDAIVMALLRLARISKQEMSVGAVDMTELATTVSQNLRQQDPARPGEIVITPGMTANADPGLVQVIYENLIGNAWKFTSKMPNGRVEVGVTDKTDGTRVFFVRDNGAGFPAEDTNKLFKPFRRLHSQADFPGTGIGLTLVHRILRKHGGKIWAESDVGKGATFYFTLAA